MAAIIVTTIAITCIFFIFFSGIYSHTELNLVDVFI